MATARRRFAQPAIGALLAGVLALAWPGRRRSGAASCRPTVAAVIDYQRILRDAAAARSIRDADRGPAQGLSGGDQQGGAAAARGRQGVRQAALGADAEAFAEKRREFEQEVAEVQHLVQERRRELDSVSAMAL